MKFLAITEDGGMELIGNFRDWVEADDYCDKNEIYFHYLAEIDTWLEYAEIINKEAKRCR